MEVIDVTGVTEIIDATVVVDDIYVIRPLVKSVYQ